MKAVKQFYIPERLSTDRSLKKSSNGKFPLSSRDKTLQIRFLNWFLLNKFFVSCGDLGMR